MIYAYAKINLRLKVIDKRIDNYHNLEMINISIDLADELSIKKVKSGDIIISSNNPTLSNNNDNIVYKIVDFMKNKFSIKDSFEITINKKIPIGAGLGGGSSDGAAVIRWFNEEYHLGLSQDHLIGLALKFGADVPYCLFSRTALVTGIGENIEFVDLDLPPYLLLVTPPISVSTKEIFDEYDRLKIAVNYNKKSNTNTFICDENILDLMKNDLKEVTFNKYPLLNEIRNTLEFLGAEKVMMSGSGPSLFYLISDFNKGKKILKLYRDKYPHHFSTLSKVINNDNKFI